MRHFGSGKVEIDASPQPKSGSMWVKGTFHKDSQTGTSNPRWRAVAIVQTLVRIRPKGQSVEALLLPPRAGLSRHRFATSPSNDTGRESYVLAGDLETHEEGRRARRPQSDGVRHASAGTMNGEEAGGDLTTDCPCHIEAA